jgi:GNAT superfamily N-acetyltransferase
VRVSGPGKPAQHQDHADLARVVRDADADEVPIALSVSDLGFAEPGTAVSVSGVPERDAIVRDDAAVAFVRNRIRDGRSVLAVLDAGPAGVVASGWHQPIGATTEVVGVATLPAFRRRGFAASVVGTLLDEAVARGCTMALLSASDDDVARIYERVGFTRIGHAGAAEPLES